MAKNKDAIEMKRRELEAELRRLAAEEREAAWAARSCRVCGEKDVAYGGEKGYLTPFEVRVNPGEEGHSEINSFLCEPHLEYFTDALADAGITIHAHGGICFLEDRCCPGHKNMDDCKTPEEQYPD